MTKLGEPRKIRPAKKSAFVHTPTLGTGEDPPLGLGYFVGYAAKQTAFGLVACVAAGLILTAFFGMASVFTSYQIELTLIWKVIGFILVFYVSVLWFCAICVGCLIMIPVEIWRFGHRRTQTDPKTDVPAEGLWDRFLDGPVSP